MTINEEKFEIGDTVKGTTKISTIRPCFINGIHPFDEKEFRYFLIKDERNIALSVEMNYTIQDGILDIGNGDYRKENRIFSAKMLLTEKVWTLK